MGKRTCHTLSAKQIKAAVKVNTEQILFNLSLGKDIAERQEENKYGSKFYATLSRDLKEEIPDVEGLSESNIRYCKRFYLLYCHTIENLPQVVEDLDSKNLPQLVEKLCSIPWGHHRLIIDRCSDNPQKALFFVNQTIGFTATRTEISTRRSATLVSSPTSWDTCHMPSIERTALTQGDALMCNFAKK